MILKRIMTVGFVVLLAVCMLIMAFVGAVDVLKFQHTGEENEHLTFAGGSGTEEDPYLIENVHQLQNMSMNLTAHYALLNDIDANETSEWNGGEGFLPIGNATTQFTGSFSGRNHTIFDLFINVPDDSNIGLFGYIGTDSVVKDIGLVDNDVTGSSQVGGIVGRVDYATVFNSYAFGNVSGSSRVGALVGLNQFGTVDNCHAEGAVNGSNMYAGGLLGYNNDGTVSNSYASVNTTGNDYVGGLIGYERIGLVFDSYATGTVNGYENVGGLVGLNTDGTVNNSFATGNVIGEYRNVGGLVGLNEGTVNNSYATGNVSGEEYYVGGLVGENGGTIFNSYSSGNVIGYRYIGGLVGNNRYGTVEKSYSTGNISGTSGSSWYIGGSVGYNDDGIVNSSYATGTVDGPSYTGGFIGYNRFGTVEDSYARGDVTRLSGSTSTSLGAFLGYNYQGKTINCYSTGAVIYEDTDNPTNKGFAGAVDTGGDYECSGNYWDVETSGQNSTAGNATGKSTEEMKTQSTFTDAGWDFVDTWHIVENIIYPLLQWQPLPEETSIVLDLYARPESDGWNFVSFNIDMTDTSLETILTDIDGSYDRLIYYDASTGQWTSYVAGRAAHFNNLHSWDHTMGVWIKMNTDAALNLTGYAPESTDITLYPGWNMVGLPSETAGNHGLPGEVTKIGYFHPSTEYNLEYDYESTTFVFEPGLGYWIYNDAEDPVAWTIEY